MPDYDSLAALRRALSTDNADARANAYGDIMEHDVQPSEVLASDPDPAAIEKLRQKDVLPDEAQTGVPVTEYHERALELLEDIKQNTGGA